MNSIRILGLELTATPQVESGTKAKKYVLLAPFIKEIKDIEQLEKKPHFYNTNYSPVVNDVVIIDIINPNDRNAECHRLSQSLGSDDKTLIYFPTVTGIYKYVSDFLVREPVLAALDDSIKYFVDWAKDEIHDDW